jgi:hypothetical protein
LVAGTFTGALLYDVLSILGPRFNPDVKNDQLRFYVSATGSDRYPAIVSWGRSTPASRTRASCSR